MPVIPSQWHFGSRQAFTLIEILIAIGIIGLLIGLLLPAMEKARHKAYIDACASNLRQIGQAIAIYSNENRGAYPRTPYVPGQPLVAGSIGPTPDPLTLPPNDVTRPLWLLARAERLTTHLFTCPYNDVNEFEADKALPVTQANFTDYRKNLGYSYANPYPDPAAASKGYRLTNKLAATFAIMADLNPGFSAAREADPFRPSPNSGTAEMRYGNSDNHEREGQNVLYADGHVTYQLTPFAGTDGDNIYTSQSAVRPVLMTSPAGPGDSVLLPVD